MFTKTAIKLALGIILTSCLCTPSPAQVGKNTKATQKPIVPGADQVNEYVPYLKGKRVGMLVNQTSTIGKKLSVDSLRTLGVDIRMIFGPEHGFRANASNGGVVADEIDPKTGIPIISLYGKKNKPTPQEMAALDIMIFDVQDVGCRFYTKIITLRDVMEACAEAGKELMILDRPNPNDYIDGPILDMKFQSGIGRFPIPVTHGLTIGEFAQMIIGQGWMEGASKCRIKVIKVKNYKHGMDYTVPVSPSPNLSSQQAIVLYPSTCLFEGAALNHGRGTPNPFTVLGAPSLKGIYNFSFTPVSIPGKSEAPLYMNEVCYGLDLRKYDITPYRKAGKINIEWMMELYKAFPDKAKFFDRSQSAAMGNIDGLAGTDLFRKQIINGTPEAEIRKTWEAGLIGYKEMRKKYLLYD